MAAHRTEMLVDLRKLKWKKVPHDSTYRRILSSEVNVVEKTFYNLLITSYAIQ